MSRTYRKKYIPFSFIAEEESNKEYVAYSAYYSEHGRTENGCKFYCGHFHHKIGCSLIRFNKNMNRDGNKAHGVIDAMVNIAAKRIKSRVRTKMNHELHRMRSGHMGWDENVVSPNRVRSMSVV